MDIYTFQYNGLPTKLGGVVKISFCFGYKIDILRDDGIKLGRTKQCKLINGGMMTSLKNIQKLTIFTAPPSLSLTRMSMSNC